jgi:hypothetical protein
VLLRVLKNDIAQYVDIEDDEMGIGEEDSGWKRVHGDVFRCVRVCEGGGCIEV